METKNWLWALLIVITATVLFIFGQILITTNFNIEITNENVILVFVGIIATFIVVSNFAQVADVKREFRQRVENVKKEHEEQYQKMAIAIDEKFRRTKCVNDSSRHLIMAETMFFLSLNTDENSLSFNVRNEALRKCLSYALSAIKYEVMANLDNNLAPKEMMTWLNSIGTKKYEMKIEDLQILETRKKELLQAMKGIPNGSQIDGFMELWKKIETIKITDNSA